MATQIYVVHSLSTNPTLLTNLRAFLLYLLIPRQAYYYTINSAYRLRTGPPIFCRFYNRHI